MNKLTLVTTTAGEKHWFNYCKHISYLRKIYGGLFNLLVLDNSPVNTFKIKKGMIESANKNFLDTVKVYHFDTFIECRNKQGELCETDWMTILDDDDQMTDGFLQIFWSLIANYPDADYFNLCKIKYGQPYYPTGKIESLSTMEDKLLSFYKYENYNEGGGR